MAVDRDGRANRPGRVLPVEMDDGAARRRPGARIGVEGLVRVTAGEHAGGGSVVPDLGLHVGGTGRAGRNDDLRARRIDRDDVLSLIHISEPTRLLSISYAVF